MGFSEDSAHFVEQGWLQITLSDPSPVEAARDAVLAHLRARWFSDLERLEDYHLFATEDALHFKIQHDVARFYWEGGFGPEVIRRNPEPFRALAGLDLHIQRYPYLRIARPDRRQDNVGFHRDIHYGSSPYEVSVHVPLTDPGIEGSLALIPGSHLESDRAYPWTRRESAEVAQGSSRHQLGFVYAPKDMGSAIAERMKPIHTQVGQALMFGLAIVHGQEVNRGPVTRFSTDIRIVNSMAPINWERSVRQDYYMPWCSSAVTEQARHFLAADAAAGPYEGESA